MNRILAFAACAALVFLPACNLLTPQQRAAGRTAIEDAYDRGELTQGQRDDAVAALEGQPVDWEGILLTGGSFLASILVGVPIAVSRTNKMRDKKYNDPGAGTKPGQVS